MEVTAVGNTSGGLYPSTTPLQNAHEHGSPYSSSRYDTGFDERRFESSLDNIRDAVGKARSFFGQYGLGERHGNGPITVQLDPSFDNAAYAQDRYGEEALIFGMDPTTGTPYGEAEDVAVHEYSHRVVNNLVDLGHSGESGTVGEHLADVFAAVLDDRDPWTIGEKIIDGGMRSMIDPSNPLYAERTPWGDAISMPDHIGDKIRTRSDNGGVHLNVGIPNKAAALIGETLGRDALGDIYVNAVANYLPDRASLSDTATAVLRSTEELFGKGSQESAAVVDAWAAVGGRKTR